MFDEYFAIKFCIIIFFNNIYKFLTDFFCPYIKKKLTMLALSSIELLNITLIIGIMMISIDLNSIEILFFSFAILINFIFILVILYEILREILIKNY